MEIIKTNTQDKRTLYNLTNSTTPKARLVAAPRGAMAVEAYAIYETTSSDGDYKKVLSIKHVNGNIYATISNTAVKSFEEIVEVFGDVDCVNLCEGISRNGRTFLYFEA